ncbi:NAD(P)H-dependent flavin oxidoreductase [Enterovibrio calviensis]|uniref:NAD(P)H-dependent flavin oxidoreductase n=1 Tax=Enterovibrio calviensis TaxID=91359 RepID=UPI000487BD65|nr:nitronate monooxygenase [Enterovibrio calviensis]
MNNKIMALLGAELPIIQAPMAGVQGSELAIAVSEAGGLGSLPCGMLSVGQIVSEIEAIRAATTRPYNLNFFCHHMPEFDQHQHAKWREVLAPYFDSLDIDPAALPNNASRLPFNHDIADAIEPFRPPFISFHFGLPDPLLLARVKGWGTKVVSSATTLKEALWLEANGADGIIAQGLEAGGHRGMFLSDDITTQIGTASLVPQIAHHVDVPVIAAGGIGDSGGVKAAMLLGAAAVQVGTAYLLCDEANTSVFHRSAILSDRAEHTALTNIFSGRPARGIVNRAMAELDYMNPLAPTFPYASIEAAPLRSHAEQQGRDDFSPLWCGQNTSGCKAISAGELTKALAKY